MMFVPGGGFDEFENVEIKYNRNICPYYVGNICPEQHDMEIRNKAFDEVLKALHPCYNCACYKTDCDDEQFFDLYCDAEQRYSYYDIATIVNKLKGEKNERKGI